MDGCSLEKSRLLIYGAGGNGIKLYQRISSCCDVLGFIDKRAKNLKNNYGTSLFDLREISIKLSAQEKADTIVVITVKNVFIHSDIARELLKAGFSFLLYKPINVLKNRGSETENLINELYESIVERAEFKFNVLIPRTTEIPFRFTDKLVIKRDAAHTTAWVPAELIFNYRDTCSYPELNMPLFFPLLELYRAFLGNAEISMTEAADNYLLYCCEWLYQNGEVLTSGRRESFLESRRSIFSEMQKMAEVEIDFFKANAPLAEKVGKKFFLKSSGRNRVAFLIAKGFKYVPIKMSRADYEDWCNIEMVHAMEASLSAAEETAFFAPHPNPYLVGYPVQFADYQRLFLEPIANEVMKPLYLNHVLEEKDLKRIDFPSVEKEKSKTTFVFQIDDDGLARDYFTSIGFRTGLESLAVSSRSYLLIDSRFCHDVPDLLNRHKFDVIYCLQRESEDGSTKLLEAYGYRLRKKMFESVYRDGFLWGLSFQKYGCSQ